MKLPIKGSGKVISDDKGILSVHYSNFSESKENKNSFKIEGENITTELVEDAPIEDIPTAFLKLHLISHRHFKPNALNMDNIFNVLETIAWTNQGPMRPEVAEKLVDGASNLKIFSLDKFPPMADYIIPSHVRIADTSRVRLGAYLGKGTTTVSYTHLTLPTKRIV